MRFNKKLLSRAFLFLRATANPWCFFTTCNAFSIRDIRLQSEVCDSSDSKKTKSLGYIRARVAGAHARSRPRHRAAQHKGVRALRCYCMNSFMQSRTFILSGKKKVLSLFREFFTLWVYIEVYTYRGWCEEETGCQQETKDDLEVVFSISNCTIMV